MIARVPPSHRTRRYAAAIEPHTEKKGETPIHSNLHAASSQWAERPADERFWNLETMHAACVASRQGSAVATVPFASLVAGSVGRDVTLTGASGKVARLTHYAFGQLAASVGAPAGYLRDLPADTAAVCLNVGLAKPKTARIGSCSFIRTGVSRCARASLTRTSASGILTCASTSRA